MWGSAVVVILLLTAGVTSFVSSLSQQNGSDYQFQNEAVRGLFGLVLLFSVYALYQQFHLRRAHIQLAEQIEIASQQHKRAEEFLTLAMLDSLTGLHNRRFGEERLEAEITRAHRSRSSLTVLMLDLDDFKRINDRYGHAAGDSALKMFAARLRSGSRGSDLAVRLGGDEFLMLLPECQAGQVSHVLNRLTPLLLDIGGKKISLEFSAGWADYRPGETAPHLLKRADDALYAKKRLGRIKYVLLCGSRSSFSPIKQPSQKSRGMSSEYISELQRWVTELLHKVNHGERLPRVARDTLKTDPQGE